MIEELTIKEFLHYNNESDNLMNNKYFNFKSYRSMFIPFLYSMNTFPGDKILDEINETKENYKKLYDTILAIQNFMSNPLLIWKNIYAVLFWICLITCISSFLIYLMTNYKKSFMTTKLSIAIFVIIRILDASFKGI
jgi:hypothetical protein